MLYEQEREREREHIRKDQPHKNTVTNVPKHSSAPLTPWTGKATYNEKLPKALLEPGLRRPCYQHRIPDKARRGRQRPEQRR